jgi:hypothetical protein
VPEIPGYELLDVLGRGGFGVVYQARQLELNRLIALKMVLPNRLVGDAERARFRHEAKVVARLKHPNIVKIHDTGEHDGLPYFVMELVTGGNLAGRLGGTTLAPMHAAQLAETLARAVHHAHVLGVVHLDLKPANVLLDPVSEAPDGTLEGASLAGAIGSLRWVPKVSDFGLARRLNPEADQSQSVQEIGGTPPYMAPEQVAGDRALISPITDVYGLGAILYECLTGRPPFKGATPLETYEQVLTQEPVPPRRLTPKVPRDLETICLKCLQKEPHKRYATAQALADDLRRFQNGHPIRARRVRLWERAVKRIRRRPQEAALIALGLVALLGVGGVYVQYRTGQEQAVARVRETLRQREDQARTDINEARKFLQLADWKTAENNAAAAVKAVTAALDDLEAQPGMLQADTEVGLRRDSLTNLRPEAESLATDAARRQEDERTAAAQRATEQKNRQEAQDRFAQFQPLRDQALLYATLALGDNLTANLNQTREAALKALKLYRVDDGLTVEPKVDSPYLRQDQKDEINRRCYELLLILADAEAQARPANAEAGGRRALQALELAGRFGAGLKLESKAYHLRRARYLAVCKEGAEARREQQLAAAIEEPTTATD